PTQPSGALVPESKTRRVMIVVAPLAVTALAFALRVVKITEAPYGFFCDEASNGLDAYWLVHSLHDQHGAFLSAFFEALGPAGCPSSSSPPLWASTRTFLVAPFSPCSWSL